MDEVNEVVTGQSTNEVGGQKQQDDVLSRLEKLESYNEKLLSETKQWRQKYKGLKTEVEEKDTMRMQEGNDFKGLYEKTLEELSVTKATVAEKERSAIKSSFKYEAAKYAPDTVDSELLIAALNSKKNVVAYDSEEGWKGIDSAIGELRKEKPYLFNSEKMGMINGRPQAVAVKEKTIEEALDEDTSGVLAGALSQLFSGKP